MGQSAVPIDDQIEPSTLAAADGDAATLDSDADEYSSLISIRELISDTAVYGFASVADRAIGFLLLPIMTAILNPADYGVISLFSTTSQICFVLFSLGIHQGFFRYYTEARDLDSQLAILNTALVLTVLYWLMTLPFFVLGGDLLNRWIFDTEGSALVWALAASSLIQVINAVASNRLQAEGRAWAYFSVSVLSSIILRGRDCAGLERHGCLGLGSLGHRWTPRSVGALNYPRGSGCKFQIGPKAVSATRDLRCIPCPVGPFVHGNGRR